MKNVMDFETDDFYCDLVFAGKIKIKKVKETERVLAFYHTQPSWSTHIVIIPKQHIAKLTDLKDMGPISEIFSIAQQIIKENGWDKTNFRIITNGGSFQDSKHLHFHLVSGDKIR
jgi:histidine triad (HIT) family protein